MRWCSIYLIGAAVMLFVNSAAVRAVASKDNLLMGSIIGAVLWPVELLVVTGRTVGSYLEDGRAQ